MSAQERRRGGRGSQDDDIYRKVVTAIPGPAAERIRGGDSKNVTRSQDRDGSERVEPRRRPPRGGDARGGTESAAVRRAHEKHPAGGRRPEEGGSPRGMRGAKRGA